MRIASEQKGQFQTEAARAEELRATLQSRDTEIKSLNNRISVLDREKTEAIKDAEAANRRATELVEKERESQTTIIAAKDQQILSLSEFIAKARDVLSTEFKALSASAFSRA